MEWEANPMRWAVRQYEQYVNLSTTFSGDWQQWRLTNESITLRLQDRFLDDFPEAQIQSGAYGPWYISNEIRSDLNS